ncbi:Cold shock protein 1 [Cardamine amara subsp. amara]|uniref:Cold shock protein 1 n=1 Tax=Cardamine amara subsp. amara TaxID=228776 RepID=A0ABD0ZGA3_CARAN
MPRHKDEKFVFDDGEDEDREDPVAIKDGFNENEEDDDEEANEDLSLKILEKALSRRDVGNKLDSKESTLSDLCGSGVVDTVIVNGGKSKKMKRNNLEAANEIPIVWKEQNEEKNTVEDVVKGEEDEPKPGEASNNMVLKKLLRGARYFDPPDAGWATCYSCGEQGHMTVNCPTPTKRRKPCFICGSLEHGAKQCSKGHDCYICKKGGHRAKDCPDKYKSGSKAAVCLRCGDFGHEMILCKYEFSQDDLKDIQCYVCKSFGHICCVEPGNSPPWAVSCYRCGQLGHTGLACGRHYDDSNENDSISPSCFKCGEEGHFSRECLNSSSISTSQGKDSLSVCYRCNGVGHFARECLNSSQGSKRDHDTSTPSQKSHKKKKKHSEHNSTPHASDGKTKKKKKKKHEEEESQTTPRKPKKRGDWMIEDLEEDSFKREKKNKKRRSSTTPSSHSHRFPTTPSSHSHRLPTTPSGDNHRSPSFNSSGHFPGSQSTIPYGRNHRNSSFESNGHHSPSHHHQHHHQQHHQHQHQHQHHHHQHHRYAPEPSRYGPTHHYGNFAGNYDRW